MEIEYNNKCTGCGACKNSCPSKAIVMQEDKKGFLKPVIDTKLCIKCNICDRVCPIYNHTSNNLIKPKAYMFINKNKKERLKSSSGAFFSCIAKYVIEHNGVVFGVIWDKNINAIQSYTQSIEGLDKMHGSKYVQADTMNTYVEVKTFLEDDILVLYTGTPCQIAGLKAYLKKDYENLILIDLVCHGVPSRKAFEDYKKSFLKKHNDNTNIIDIQMRPKPVKNEYVHYWIIKTQIRTYKIPMEKNPYILTFLYNMDLCDSCNDCKFNVVPRIGDITMGDFSGIEHFKRNLTVEKGVSVILLNNEKGDKIFQLIKNSQETMEIPFDKIIKYNQNIIKSTIPHEKRNEFFNKLILNEEYLEYFSQKYIKITPYLLMKIYYVLPKFLKDIIKRIVRKR